MTLPSFARLKVLVTVALLAAVVGVPTQGEAQLSVVTGGVHTEGLPGADVVCPKVNNDPLTDAPIDFAQGPEHLSHWIGPPHPPYDVGHTDVVWVSGGYGFLDVDAKFKKCVQGFRVTSKLIDTTGELFCQTQVESTPTSETDTVAEPYYEGGRITAYIFSADTDQELLVTYFGKEHYPPDDDSLPNPPSLRDSGLIPIPSQCVRRESVVTVRVKSEFKNQSGKWVYLTCKDFKVGVSYTPGFNPQYFGNSFDVHECAEPL